MTSQETLDVTAEQSEGRRRRHLVEDSSGRTKRPVNAVFGHAEPAAEGEQEVGEDDAGSGE